MPEYLPQCSTFINNKTVVWLHLIIITHLATECRKPVCFFPALNGLKWTCTALNGLEWTCKVHDQLVGWLPPTVCMFPTLIMLKCSFIY